MQHVKMPSAFPCHFNRDYVGARDVEFRSRIYSTQFGNVCGAQENNKVDVVRYSRFSIKGRCNAATDQIADADIIERLREQLDQVRFGH